MCVCVCEHACVCMCVCVSAHVCACVCVCRVGHLPQVICHLARAREEVFSRETQPEVMSERGLGRAGPAC